MSYIGIDIGGTWIAGGVVDEAGKIIDREERATPIKEGGPRILQEAIEVAKALKQRSKGGIQGIGIGAGGQIDTEQGLVYSATDVIPGWKGMHITEAFTKEFGVPAAVDNDVNVLGVAETRFGAARQFASKGIVVFLALGTGVGGAVLINGAVLHGAHWSGGELGHIRIFPPTLPDVRQDLGGAKGTLEAYCSGSALVQTYRELTGNNHANITGEDIAKEAQADPKSLASEAIRKTGEYLGCGLVTLADAFDPNLIIVGGGLSELGDALLEPARRVLKEHALARSITYPVVTPQLGIDAPIIGAASLVMNS